MSATASTPDRQNPSAESCLGNELDCCAVRLNFLESRDYLKRYFANTCTKGSMPTKSFVHSAGRKLRVDCPHNSAIASMMHHGCAINQFFSALKSGEAFVMVNVAKLTWSLEPTSHQNDHQALARTSIPLIIGEDYAPWYQVGCHRFITLGSEQPFSSDPDAPSNSCDLDCSSTTNLNRRTREPPTGAGL